MQQNIELSLQNAVKLEDIRDRAENLSNQASVFKKKGKELKNNMQWRNIKVNVVTIIAYRCRIIVA
jgi:propanediol dehydratase small subunit